MQALWKPDTVEEYYEVQRWLGSVKDRSVDDWEDAMRWYCTEDLFYLLNFVLTDGQIVHSHYKKPYHFHQFFLDMCRSTEYQASRGGGIDVSARGGAKSTVRTKAFPISMLLKHPDISIVIFSVEKQLGEKHLYRIKKELEVNELLKTLFNNVLWESQNDAIKNGVMWSMEHGICVKRKIVRANQTVETHSMNQGGPVGSRFEIVLGDDMESSDSVNSPEKIDKLNKAFSETTSLMTPIVIDRPILLISNTRFSQAGLIQFKLDEYLAVDSRLTRCIPAEDKTIKGEGPLGGTALYPFTYNDLWHQWNTKTNKADYALQYALDYVGASEYALHQESIQRYSERPSQIASDANIYICIDASNGVVDPSCFWVWAAKPDQRLYWVDATVRKMDPSKPPFHDELYRMIRYWESMGKRVVQIRIEQMGNQTWAALVASELRARGVSIPVIPCKNPGKKTGLFSTVKLDRIYSRWSPLLNAGRIVFPIPAKEGGWGIMSSDDSGARKDLMEYFMGFEFLAFPQCKHEDMLDAGGLIQDDKANEETPISWGSKRNVNSIYNRPQGRLQTTWMSG